MRRLILALSLIAPAVAAAQTPSPEIVSLPAPDIIHVVNLLRNGGTRAEADDLAAKIVAAAQADVAAKAQSAPKARADAVTQTAPIVPVPAPAP